VTLRTRLLLAAAVLAAVIALGGVAVVGTQRSYLIDQVDDRLTASLPFVRPPGDGTAPALPDVTDGPTRPDPAADRAADLDPPISSLFVGWIGDGELHVFLQGQLLDDVPDLPTDPDRVAAMVNGEPFTAPGANGSTTFRVSVTTRPGTDDPWVIALPLDEVDGAVARLKWTLVAIAGVLGVVLAAAFWWVHRLGLRPVARVTAAADAIAGGDHGRRVDVANPRTEAGRLARAFNLMLDERDASEAQVRQFAADASHELRTPLTSIRGYLDLYHQGGFREQAKLDDMMRRLRQESGRMNDLVEDLLLLARLDQHRPMRQEPVDIERVLRDLASDAAAIQPDRAVRVSVEPGASPTVVGDAYRIQQVLSALVTNALWYTNPDTEVALVATATDRNVTVTVADHGPGLSAEDAAHVFDRFYRGDQSRTRRTGGSGLGLAIAKSIVDAHHGTIALDTRPGAGCRFTVTLPRDATTR